MEKGNARNTSTKSSSTSELKSKPDGPNKYARYTRYKPENISPRPDARLNANPHKNREPFDRRPRTRIGTVCERYRNEIATDVLGAEGGGKPKSKKVNLNYLLNFTYSPIEDSGARRSVRNYRLKHPKYNKEQFLQANCQFIACENGDYSLHHKNPDNLVQWSLIEEVRVPCQEYPSCPICLHMPVAAKITRCGHIYCWPCILHYLALTDRSWHKCPICFEAIHAADLKSVQSITQETVVTGNTLTMCLMKREKGSMFPTPVNFQSSSSVYRVCDANAVTKYQKLLLASKSDVHNVIVRERNELDAQMFQEKDEPESCFIASALELLQERENKLFGIAETNGKEAGTPLDNVLMEEMPTKNTTLFNDPQYGTFHLDEDICGTSPSNQYDGKGLSVSPPNTSGDSHQRGKGTFYFYQSADGQNIYLHGLSVKMLIREFGALEDCPPVIEGKVLELENMSMNEAVRNRLRYLQHIPLTCEFQVAEVNLQHLLSERIIEEYAGEVAKRHKLRNRKAHEERKREKYIQEVEDQKMGKYPGATYNLSSNAQFPKCDSSNLPQELPPQEYVEEYEVQYPRFGFQNLSLNDNEEKIDAPVTSFAEMLRDGHTGPNKSTSFEQKKMWKVSENNNLEHSDEEFTTSVPHQSFGDSFQAALERALVQRENNAGDRGKGRKKKKQKNFRVLFTTDMNCNKRLN